MVIKNQILYGLLFLFMFAGCTNTQNDTATQQSTKTDAEEATVDIKELENFWDQSLADNDKFYKVTFPRTDIKLRLDGHKVLPGLAYTSWIAYWPMDDSTRIMGDMVLLDEELPKVLPFLKSNGIQITAIHNHLLRETPRLMYMHFAGTGDALELSKIMKGAYELTSTPLKENNTSSKTTVNPNWEPVKKILGKNGSDKGRILKYSFPRKENVRMQDNTMPATFGIATAIGFQAISKDSAVITGDFVMLESEVNAVINKLAENDIEVTALHNHMLHEEPRLFYMHFWATGNAEKLASGFKEALKETNSVQ